MITALEVPTDPSHPAWGPYTWPDKVYEQGFRPHQLSATEEIIEHFNRGVDVVLLDAPTGTGKSFVAEMVRRLMVPNGRALYCPDTKNLQDQLMYDFGHYAKLLKGRSNYPTHDHPELFSGRWNRLSAADCVREKKPLPACSDCKQDSDGIEMPHCLQCHPISSCPYRIAVNQAEAASLAILNTSYFLAESNHGMGRFKGVDLAIIDEADVLPNTLMNQVEVFFSAKRIAEFDIPFPEKKTVPESWAEWVEKDALPCLTGHMTDVRQQLNRYRDLDLTRKLTWLTDQVGKLRLLQKSLEAGNAVYDGYEQGNIRFQPVSVAPFAPSMLWAHAERFLLMSGSFDPIDEFIDSSGITVAEKQYEIVKVPMMFDVARRPIIVKGVTEMTFKNKAIAWPVMAAKVSYILKTRHPNDRVLVHCASYEYTRFLYERLRNIGRPVIVYEDAAGRSDALEQYKMLPGAVLLAPSMDRGVDLPGDLCAVPGTLVRTWYGYKPIEEIKIGDRVWTHKHRYKRVTAVGQRRYEGELVGIATYMGPTQWFTPEHPILTTQYGRFRTFRLPSGRWVQHGQVRSVRREWVAASDLTSDHRPVLATGAQEKQMRKQLGAAFAGGRHKTSTRQVPNQWDDTPDFWRLAGLWAAEGNTSRHENAYKRSGPGRQRMNIAVVWSFGWHEHETLAKECADLVESVLGNKRPEPVIYGSGSRVSIKNTAYGTWLKRNIGDGAANKRVPTRLLNHPNDECRRAFLEGYWAGDGNHGDGELAGTTVYEATSASIQLALGIRDLAMTLGYASTLRTKQVNGTEYYKASWTLNPRGGRKTAKDIFSRSNTVERKHYSGDVHNLTVAQDESYCTPSFTVHNCRAIIVTKVPWPSLKDKRVIARKYARGGERWYVAQAVRKLVQSLGRGMRSEEDQCTHYILDKSFIESIWKSHKALLPSWLKDALDWSGAGL